MEGVPVKISERHRPPKRIYLDSHNPNQALQLRDLQYSFDAERNAVAWIKQRRLNLIAARELQQSNIAAKDAELARKAEEESKIAGEVAAQKAQLDRESALTNGISDSHSNCHELSSSGSCVENVGDALANATPQHTGTSAFNSLSSHAADVPGAVSGRGTLNSATDTDVSTSHSHTPSTISSDVNHAALMAGELNGSTSHDVPAGMSAALNRPGDELKLVESSRPQQTVRVVSSEFCPPVATPADFNYRDFEDQASDPFDSMTLKSLNNMTELARVFDQPACIGPAFNGSATVSATPPQYFPGGGGSGLVGGQLPGASSLMFASAGRFSQSATCNINQTAAPVVLTATSTAHSATLTSNVPPASHSMAVCYPSASHTSSSSSPPLNSHARHLHDFYTRYYQPNRVPQCSSTSTSTAAVAAAAVGGKLMRASRSVPDLTADMNCGRADTRAASGSDGVWNRRTPPPCSRASSGRQHAQATASVTSTCSPVANSACELSRPDGVDTDTWQQILRISEMGFQIDRLLKYHQFSRGDNKQLVDLAVCGRQLQEECGGCDAVVADTALLHCHAQLDECRHFITVHRQLVELGFSSARVLHVLQDARAVCRNTALDLLLQSQH